MANKQVANFFDKGLIRCVKMDENGEMIVKYLSPYVVKSEFLFERTGFKPDDPNLDEKLGIKNKEIEAPQFQQVAEVRGEENTGSVNGTDGVESASAGSGIKQTSTASSLIERFTADDGTPRRKRKRTNIKIHHAD